MGPSLFSDDGCIPLVDLQQPCVQSQKPVSNGVKSVVRKEHAVIGQEGHSQAESSLQGDSEEKERKAEWLTGEHMEGRDGFL